jgi:hypothetical protein
MAITAMAIGAVAAWGADSDPVAHSVLGKSA